MGKNQWYFGFDGKHDIQIKIKTTTTHSNPLDNFIYFCKLKYYN